ncbi:MAG: PEP-CTERM sorting domain-containing protein [Beijerinckiaceae bacterium]|nr:PEP-CTERM sorting domain-containing protein [Beijerinckiaceae bacterium]
MPEPSMVLLFGAAAAGLVARRRHALKAKVAVAA